MKKGAFIFSFLLFLFANCFSQSIAVKRANSIGKGMNLTWLDQRWRGTDSMQHRDYLNLHELPKYKAYIKLMHELGYEFLRLPVCFDLWYAQEVPYQLLTPQYYSAIDSILQWTQGYNMKISIDNHHGKIRSKSLNNDVARICAIWKDVVTRYKGTDPERVFFEIFNEPSEVHEEEWYESAKKIISAIREVDQQHTLIVGAAKWNGMDALLNMSTFADNNIIYTFHYYDPFIFTHQGASWVGDAGATTGIPYPFKTDSMPAINERTAKTWAAGAYDRYPSEANYKAMFERMKKVSDWSHQNKVPIFCGEWGAYKAHAAVLDRCQYIKDVYSILEKLKIPNAMWEWHEGFSFFNGAPSKENISPCVKNALKIK